MVANLGSWRYADRRHRLKFFADQGLTTILGRDGSSSLLYRGERSIPSSVRKSGWVHIGDPDSSGGYVFDAYQGGSGATSKMFRVTAPQGDASEHVHPLDMGELFNNSFVAVSPDGQWMISGEWGVMSRFLVFPTPMLNPAAPASSAPLSSVGTIVLDRPVRNVQGATFETATRLLCSTDDPDSDLWPTPRQLLQVDLGDPLRGTTVRAQVTSLGELPTESLCPGTFEVEGIDYDSTTGDLRVDIVPPLPCGLFAATYRFHRT